MVQRAAATGSGRTEGLLAGKLPNELLAQLLSRITHGDARVLVGPGVGHDAAVIDTGGPRLLVAKADPITFATDLIGWYAVNVNANDIACTGGRPTWFLATVLLPDGCPPDLPGQIFTQVTEACDELEIELVGGHTEITYRLDRPILSGAMLGEVERDRLVRPESARPGDAVILTKGIAIEGTSVLAREAPGRLMAVGVAPDVLTTAGEYLFSPGISIVTDARAACHSAGVRALHDPTEGGLATALYELAEACGAGLDIDGDTIEVLPETRLICDAAGLDPLGLLASGALLIVVPGDESAACVAALEHAGAPARRIGSLAPKRRGVIIRVNNQPAAVRRFDRDEVARYLSERPDEDIEA